MTGSTRIPGFLALLAGMALVFAEAAVAQDYDRIPSEEAMAAVEKKEDPVYPPMAKRMGVEGVVEIDVFIDGAGKVTAAKRVSGHPVLANAAVKALSNWEFKPIDDKAVVTTLTLEFRQ